MDAPAKASASPRPGGLPPVDASPAGHRNAIAHIQSCPHPSGKHLPLDARAGHSCCMHAHATGSDAGRALTVPWGSEAVTLHWQPPTASTDTVVNDTVGLNPSMSPALVAHDPLASDSVLCAPARPAPTSGTPTRRGDDRVRSSPTPHRNSPPQPSPLQRPTPDRLAVGVFRSLIEVLTGLRPASQLMSIAHPDARAALTILTAQERWSDASLLSVRCCVPCAGVVEGSATLRRHDRVVAATTRLEHPDTKWLLRHLAVLEPCALARQRATALGLRP